MNHVALMVERYIKVAGEFRFQDIAQFVEWIAPKMGKECNGLTRQMLLAYLRKKKARGDIEVKRIGQSTIYKYRY